MLVLMHTEHDIMRRYLRTLAKDSMNPATQKYTMITLSSSNVGLRDAYTIPSSGRSECDYVEKDFRVACIRHL